MADSGRMKSPVQAGDLVAGKYRVERVLGAGGMGVVVAARHVDLDQLVALKFILPHALAGKGSVERFMREARAAVRLKSEHVARVYDVGRDGDDRPFMVLELLEGMDLAKLIKTKGSPAVADAVEYVLQACEGLVEAHAAGIVHRDLKPQNLFVTRRLNGTALVKVLDFGIAKAIGPGAEGQMALTDSAAIIGSPLYMAPEQMRSARTAEVRSDIWALGVILYELLGGAPPFDGETVTAVCIRVVNEQPASLVALRPALDPSLVAIVMRCLEKDPKDRFHNVAALASALEPFSRSAQQAGPVRPWRSFEDTQDSLGGERRAAAEDLSLADATGPSTQVTIETMPRLDELDESPSADEHRAGAGGMWGASGARAAAGGGGSVGRPGRGSGEDGRLASVPPLISTDVAWGPSDSRGLERERDRERPARSFSTGVVAAIVVTVAAAAVVFGVVVGRGASSAVGVAAASSTSASNASGAGPEVEPAARAKADAEVRANAEAAEANAAAAEAKAEANAAAEANADADASAGATAARAGVAAAAPSVGGARAGGAGSVTSGKPRGTTHKRTEPRGATSAATPQRSSGPTVATPTEPVSPNGAPILH